MMLHPIVRYGLRLSRARLVPILAAAGLTLAPHMVSAADNTAPSASPVLPEHTELAYDVYFGGSLIAEAKARFEWSDTDYRIGGTVHTVGFTNWLTAYRGDTLSQGQLVDGRFSPIMHRNFGSFRGKDRLTEITYSGQDTANVSVEPAPDWSELTPLPDDPGAGTLDPMSTVFAVAFSMRNGAECQGTYPVFDGRRRYDVTVEPAPARDLEAAGYSIFTGLAETCTVSEFKRIGGFRKQHSDYTDTIRKREAHVARLTPKGIPVPVRIEVETGMGSLVIHLVGYKGQGLDLTLPKGS